MMRRCGLTILVGCLAVLAVPVLSQEKPVDIAGVWEMSFQTPQGDMTSDITFTQEGETIKASMVGMQGMEMEGEGTVKGGEVEWTFVISTPNGDFTLVYSGKVSGEEMTGEVAAGDFGSFPWSAKKKK